MNYKKKGIGLLLILIPYVRHHIIRFITLGVQIKFLRITFLIGFSALAANITGSSLPTIISNDISIITNRFVLEGIVVDAGSNEFIDYATITIKEIVSDKILAGTTTDNGGKFSIETSTKEIYLEVSFIGYTSLVIRDFKWEGNLADLGVIKLGENTELLDEVTVTAAKSTTEFKLDKRVFNVGTDLSSTGASALEVLNNVPSVNVSIEGDITLRGSSGVQILINGKPSVIADESSGALGTITADMIEQVEVITNPSAKYEAEGTSGIINIVLKKNEKKGLNGSLTLNTGWPHNHSLGLSLGSVLPGAALGEFQSLLVSGYFQPFWECVPLTL